MVELLKLALEVGAHFAREFADAMQNGDEVKWRRIADILPEELQSRAKLLAEESKTRRELEDLG